MGNWFKSHYRILIALLLFAVSYYIFFRVSLDYVDFREIRSNGSINVMEFNMNVARFYFLQLPLSASIPSLFYMIVSYLNNKITQ